MKSGGFTLLEVMIAIGIFSLIGLASFQMLKSTADTGHRLREADAKIFSLQKAFSIISSDFTQLVARPTRDELGDEQPAFNSNNPDDINELVSFTRMTGTFFSGDEKLLLQRVSYGLEERDDDSFTRSNNSGSSRVASNIDSNQDNAQRSLYRYIWPVLDLVEAVEPQKQLLLEGVSSVDFQFYDHNGETTSSWPNEPEENGSGPNSNPESSADSNSESTKRLVELPTGIQITIESGYYGSVDRIFARAQVSLTADE